MGDIIAQNFLLGALIAFGAGFLTVFTPCSLTSIPLIVNYMSGKEKTAKKPPRILFLYAWDRP